VLASNERRRLFPPVSLGDLTKLNADRGFRNSPSEAPYQERWFTVSAARSAEAATSAACPTLRARIERLRRRRISMKELDDLVIRGVKQHVFEAHRL
jgi:hypothetical protein